MCVSKNEFLGPILVQIAILSHAYDLKALFLSTMHFTALRIWDMPVQREKCWEVHFQKLCKHLLPVKMQYAALCHVTNDVIANMASPAHGFVIDVYSTYCGLTLSAHSILEWHQILLESLLQPV